MNEAVSKFEKENVILFPPSGRGSPLQYVDGSVKYLIFMLKQTYYLKIKLIYFHTRKITDWFQDK